MLAWDLYWRHPPSGGLVSQGSLRRASPTAPWTSSVSLAADMAAGAAAGPSGNSGSAEAAAEEREAIDGDPLSMLLSWGVVGRAAYLLGAGKAPGGVRACLRVLTAVAMAGEGGAQEVWECEWLGDALMAVWSPPVDCLLSQVRPLRMAPLSPRLYGGVA